MWNHKFIFSAMKENISFPKNPSHYLWSKLQDQIKYLHLSFSWRSFLIQVVLEEFVPRIIILNWSYQKLIMENIIANVSAELKIWIAELYWKKSRNVNVKTSEKK